MPLESFYSTASTLFFTLLGFWWVVVQFKHDKWSRDPARRRMAYVVSLHFLLPGVMCVASLLSGETPIVWNIVFAAAGLLGVLAAFLGAVPSRRGEREMPYHQLGQVAAVVLYALITLLAIFPRLPAALGFDVPALVLEAIMLTLLAVLSVTLAWFLFMEPAE